MHVRCLRVVISGTRTHQVRNHEQKRAFSEDDNINIMCRCCVLKKK